MRKNNVNHLCIICFKWKIRKFMCGKKWLKEGKLQIRTERKECMIKEQRRFCLQSTGETLGLYRVLASPQEREGVMQGRTGAYVGLKKTWELACGSFLLWLQWMLVLMVLINQQMSKNVNS